jgi:tRNA A-37 threonylcarbamoyl transferase component Bud32
MARVVPKKRLAGRYVIEEHVADGGMASVWRALDDVLARRVAVKTLREDLARRQNFRERFHREAVASAKLNHPAIVSIFDTGVDDGIAYIVMEYFESRTLAEVATGGRPLEVPEAIGLIIPVLDALAYAHQAGIVHRDIKPGNILVGSANRVKVADFGLAKALSGEDLTTTGKVLGTVRYLSPEQVRGDEVDARSDLYAVGVVLYELIAGRPPFQAETDIATAMMRLTADPVPLRSLVPGLPRSVEGAILRAMAQAPEDRFQTAESMRSALDRWAETEARPPAPPPPVTRPADTSSGSTFRSWMLVPLLIVLLAVAVVAAGIALGRLELGGPIGVRQAEGGGEPVRLVAIQSVRDFDPFGEDGSENPDEAALAVDGDEATAWSTDHYNTAALGGLKPGVGLFLDLGDDHEVSRITVESPAPGWTFELLPGSSPDQDVRPLRGADGSTRFSVPESGRLVIEIRPVRIPGLMIWITQLAPDPQGDRFVAEVGEVEISGPRS